MPDAATLLKFRRLLVRNQLTRELFDEINAHLDERGLLMRVGTIASRLTHRILTFAGGSHT